MDLTSANLLLWLKASIASTQAGYVHIWSIFSHLFSICQSEGCDASHSTAAACS